MNSLKNIFILIDVFLCIVYVIAGLNVDLTPFSYIYILLLNIYCVYYSRRNLYMLIVCGVILYCNYSIIFANYIGDIDSVYVHQYGNNIECVSLNILTLFNALYSILILNRRHVNPIEVKEIIVNTNKNTLIVLALSAVLVYVFMFGYAPPEFLGDRGHPKPIYEYSVLLFIIMFYYTGNNRVLILIATLFVVAFALQEFVYGGRIMALQFLLVAYTMYYIKIIPVKYVVGGGVFMLIFMTFIGVVRGSLLSGNFDISSILSSFLKEGLALDTAYSAYNTSETFVIAGNSISDSAMPEYIKAWLLSFFLGESANRDMTLGFISQHYGFHSFGGVYPFYFYFYFGILGVMGSLFLILPYIRHCFSITNQSSKLSNLICVFFVCHTFRWYLYNPLGLVRSLLFFVILFWGAKTFHSFTRHKHKKAQTNILKSYD